MTVVTSKHRGDYTPQLYDFFFRNYFDTDSFFKPIFEQKPNHPVNIYETEDGIFFEVACTGIPKELVEVSVDGDILKIVYDSSKHIADGKEKTYVHRGISQKSFNLGWRTNGKYNLSNADAKFADGLLTVKVPFAEVKKPKTLLIK